MVFIKRSVWKSIIVSGFVARVCNINIHTGLPTYYDGNGITVY